MTFYEQLQTAAVSLGANWLVDFGALNIVGVRNTVELDANSFNDLVCIAYMSRTYGPCVLICEATTDPGIYWRKNLANVKGTAVLPRGHHKRLWCLGKHQGKYVALVQSSPVGVLRDRNRDSKIDLNGVLDVGMHGIALHRANEHVESKQVDKWSAGCQVIASPAQYDRVIELAHTHARTLGNSFDYTLVHDVDIGLKWGGK
ncbi:hypothetical protein [Cellvibrio mixtus]|uniref:hypothetical protein n=1 Tax=Cellvibrio mixtus TaxID=39650 RepID=UPI000587605B|nr:hypothetical protein [Cellvibrio mixtus]